MTEPTPKGPWDKKDFFNLMSREEMMDVAAKAPTCVFIRTRSDGHPIGAVVASEVIDGEIYCSTNVFRAAFKNIQRDPRCCVTFDIPLVAGVSVIGRAEIIDDHEEVKRFFRYHAYRAPAVVNDGMGVDEYVATAATENRRLFRIIPEKMFGSKMSLLAGQRDTWNEAQGARP